MVSLLTVLALGFTHLAQAEIFGGLAGRIDRRVAISSEVLSDRMASMQPIPSYVIQNARCIASMRVVKAGFIFGGEGSTGLVSCRTAQGWSEPAFLNVGGATFGLQIGVQVMDTVLVFVTDYARQILTRPTFQLGTDVSVAAGPLGEGAGAGWVPTAHVLSYSHAGGLYAGITVNGTVLAQGPERNAAVYGPYAQPAAILNTPGFQAPQVVQPFVNTVEQYAR